MRLAVVLFNLGGPDAPGSVEPFLRNLFSDPAIISLPGFLRRPLAAFIARRRAPVAQAIYAHIGGASPLLAETQAQGVAIEQALSARGVDAKCFIAMRYWHPMTAEAVAAAKTWSPDRVVLVPLYPQFSTTTTQSSLALWRREAARQGLDTPTGMICCYPWEDGLVTALADRFASLLGARKPGLRYRVLFSAHGLPERVIARGDPYQWQVEQTVAALCSRIGAADLDRTICYQSRVGPLQWIGPSVDAEIRRAGAEGLGVIIVPVAFVSEHSETLVELDIEYAKLAAEAGVAHYLRVPTVRAHPAFIAGLSELVMRAARGGSVTCAASRICPKDRICAYGGE